MKAAGSNALLHGGNLIRLIGNASLIQLKLVFSRRNACRSACTGLACYLRRRQTGFVNDRSHQPSRRCHGGQFQNAAACRPLSRLSGFLVFVMPIKRFVEAPFQTNSWKATRRLSHAKRQNQRHGSSMFTHGSRFGLRKCGWRFHSMSVPQLEIRRGWRLQSHPRLKFNTALCTPDHLSLRGTSRLHFLFQRA